MSDKSPGNNDPPSETGSKPKGTRTLRDRVFFFEKIFWGARESSVEGVTEEPDAAAEALESSGEKSQSTLRAGDEGWEWVHSSADTSLAEDIERRIEERRERASKEDPHTPLQEWAQRSQDRSNFAAQIEKKLEKHRQEVQLRIAQPQEWPTLKVTPRSSRDPSPKREYPEYSIPELKSVAGKRSGEESVFPSKKIVVRQVISKAERKDGKVVGETSTENISDVWSEDAEIPTTEYRTETKVFTEDDPEAKGYQLYEEQEIERSERGSRIRHEKRVIKQSVERSVTSDVLPGERPGSRTRSRTPSVERILEEDNDEEEIKEHLAMSTKENVDDSIEMEAASQIKWEPDSSGEEVRRFSTKVTIRETPSHAAYTHYHLATRSASKDSLLSNASSDEGLVKDWIPPWAYQKTLHPESDDDDDEDSVTFHDRFSQYQAHISNMKGMLNL